MNYLVDTNILARLVEPPHAMHQQARDAVALLIRQSHTLCIVSQNYYEFWVVATRPANVNGLGKTAAEALADITYFEGLFHWLDETQPIYGAWKHLVASTPIIGKNAHDERLRGYVRARRDAPSDIQHKRISAVFNNNGFGPDGCFSAKTAYIESHSAIKSNVVVLADEDNTASVLLSINPKFGAILERSRARLESEGGLSTAEVRKRLGIPAKPRTCEPFEASAEGGGRRWL